MKNLLLLCTILFAYTTQAQKAITTVRQEDKNTLGEYTARGRETRVIGFEENLGMVFTPTNTKSHKVKSILLNFKKIPNAADLVFTFYETDDSKGFPTPELDHKIASFEYKLSACNGITIVEIPVPNNVAIPSKGIFVSFYTKQVYSKDNTPLAATTLNELPQLHYHKTSLHNFYIITPEGKDATMEKKFFQSGPYEPSVGLTLLQ